MNNKNNKAISLIKIKNINHVLSPLLKQLLLPNNIYIETRIIVLTVLLCLFNSTKIRTKTQTGMIFIKNNPFRIRIITGRKVKRIWKTLHKFNFNSVIIKPVNTVTIQSRTCRKDLTKISLGYQLIQRKNSLQKIPLINVHSILNKILNKKIL